MLLRAVRALSARQPRQTGGGESGGSVPGVAAAGRDAAPGEGVHAGLSDATPLSARSDIRYLRWCVCVCVDVQYSTVSVCSGKSEVEEPACASSSWYQMVIGYYCTLI